MDRDFLPTSPWLSEWTLMDFNYDDKLNIFRLFPLAGSFFRLPKWLYNPMKIVSHLPSTFLQIESRAKKTGEQSRVGFMFVYIFII